MKAPEPVRAHPNATFVLGTAPLSALLGWLISVYWKAMPSGVAAAGGTILSSACLVFAHSIKHASRTVWDLGIVGCARRIWKGNKDDATPAA